MIKIGPSRALIVFVIFCFSVGGAYPQKRSGQPTPARPDAKVFFVDLKDGATVPSKFTVHFGAANIEIVPTKVAKPNSGHHHLLIDSPMPALDQPIPSDPNHLHFGRGQTESEIILPAGRAHIAAASGRSRPLPS